VQVLLERVGFVGGAQAQLGRPPQTLPVDAPGLGARVFDQGLAGRARRSVHVRDKADAARVELWLRVREGHGCPFSRGFAGSFRL
jgi:hypothetical protein